MSELKLEKRELTGKKAKRLLNDEYIPAVLYNRMGQSNSVKVSRGELERVLREATTTTVIDVKLDDRVLKAIVKEISSDPRTDALRHVSLFEVDDAHVGTYEIPITLVGVAPAVKNNLGVLIQPTQTLEIKCKLANLVPEIQVDISALQQPGEGIILSDIKLPEGLELVRKDLGDRAIATIGQLQKLVEELIEEEKAELGITEEEVAAEGVEGAEGTAAEGAVEGAIGEDTAKGGDSDKK